MSYVFALVGAALGAAFGLKGGMRWVETHSASLKTLAGIALCVLAVVCAPQAASRGFAQSGRTVKLIGWVYDDAQPLRGATVTIIKNGKRIAGGICDSNGKFTIRWPRSRGARDLGAAVLRADFAGYYPREYPIRNLAALDEIIISLSPTLARHSVLSQSSQLFLFGGVAPR